MASLVPFVGALALGLVLCGLFLRWWKIKSMEIFFLAYLFILLCWPYHDARFLLPVVPLAIGWLTMLERPFVAAVEGCHGYMGSLVCRYRVVVSIL